MKLMKNNLNRQDVKDFYITECVCLKALDILSVEVKNKLTSDIEFNKWFLKMFDMFASQFVEFTFKNHNASTIKREEVVKSFHNFVLKKQKDKEREDSYRDSRPDLYE